MFGTPPTVLPWPENTAKAIAAIDGSISGWYTYAKGGTTVADWNSTYIALALAAARQRGVGPTSPVLIDLGVNDVGFTAPWVLPNQTTWQNGYIAILDAIHVQYPSALIYLTKPYKSGGVDSVFDTMAGWIDNVVAVRAFARVGDDERSWLPSKLDPDGVHFYNAAAQAEKVNQMKAVLGY